MIYVSIAFGLATLVLLTLLLLQNKETKNITRQLKEIKQQDSNTLIHSSGSSTSKELANEINSLLKELSKAKADYRQKNHAHEQMMTNISHDLRTPLTSAMGYIDLIQRSELSEEEKSRELAVVEKRLINLEELINSFFELSQIISSGIEPEKAKLNLVTVIEEAIAHYYDDYSKQGRQIILDSSNYRYVITSNRRMLLRIFDNLISNALKHGTGDLTITAEERNGIQLTFTNELTSTDLNIEHIFDEFYTTDISRTKGNTGLGLAIAKQFTQMLGGSIEATHHDGKFMLTIILK